MKRDRNSKKGAIEMSITTIIVIVIGITLLTLGLTWVRGIFTKLDKITSGTFDQATVEIGKIRQGGGEKLNMPSSVTVKQGSKETVQSIVYNEDTSSHSFEISGDMTAGAGATGIENKVQAKIISSPQTVTLAGNQEVPFDIQVVATTDAPLTSNNVYNVVVKKDGALYISKTLTINVEKSGIFG